MRFSAKERRKNIRDAKPFATPEQMQLFSRVWQLAVEDFSGKPVWSEWDVVRRTEIEAEIYSDLEEGETRIERVNVNAPWLTTPLELLQGLDEDEVAERAARMSDNVSMRSDFRYSIHAEPQTNRDRRTFWQNMESIHGVNFFNAIDQRIATVRERAIQNARFVFLSLVETQLFSMTNCAIDMVTLSTSWVPRSKPPTRGSESEPWYKRFEIQRILWV